MLKRWRATNGSFAGSTLYEDCINSGELDLLSQFIADEYAGLRGERGPAAFAYTVASLRQGFPDIRFTIEELIAEGDRVAVRWKWQGTHAGTFNGIPASQKQAINEGTVIYHVKNGKIVQSWIQTDRLGVLQQIGLIPSDLAVLRLPPGGLAGVTHISVSIDRSPQEVYDFASQPENLARWATGLGGAIKHVNDEWVADAPMGRIKIRMAKKNAFGILDHDVTLESGSTIHNPMRVVPNGDGSEVIFTMIRQPSVSDEKFTEDARWVEKDLKILKDLLER